MNPAILLMLTSAFGASPQAANEGPIFDPWHPVLFGVEERGSLPTIVKTLSPPSDAPAKAPESRFDALARSILAAYLNAVKGDAALTKKMANSFYTLRANFGDEDDGLSVHAHLATALDTANIEARYYHWDGVVPGGKLVMSTLGMIPPLQSHGLYRAMIEGYVRLIIDDYRNGPYVTTLALVPKVTYGILEAAPIEVWTVLLTAEITTRKKSK
jgi:hypothetical protein